MDATTAAPGSLAEALAQIPDPRRAHLRAHGLVPLLQMAVAAMLCGARSLYAVAQWGQERREDHPDLLVDLGLKPGRCPSVATVHRVFKRLDVGAFEHALGNWLAQTDIAPDEPLGLDGKTLRGIHGEEIPGVHLVSVYALRARAVLTQIGVREKGAELPATKEALSQVDLAGHVVMGDALQTQREVCEQIVARGGDYLLPVKENQPALLADLVEAFSPSGAGSPPDGKSSADTAVGAGGLEETGRDTDEGLPRRHEGASRAVGAPRDVGVVGSGTGGVCGERGDGGKAMASFEADLLGEAGAHATGCHDRRNRLWDHERGPQEGGGATPVRPQPGVLGDRESAALGKRRDDG